ncbi:MAG: acetyl-CoA carboxylase biotin carboxyl carrier protein subunit [Candidatus Kryptoniota bacterium]
MKYLIVSEHDGHLRVKVDDIVKEIVYSDDIDGIEIFANGTTTKFRIFSDHDLILQSLTSEKAGHHHQLEMKAPMPGLVLNILVKKGDNIRSGETLAILEAMKMENEIRVPQNAEVTDILVRAGDIVEKDQVIAVLK